MRRLCCAVIAYLYVGGLVREARTSVFEIDYIYPSRLSSPLKIEPRQISSGNSATPYFRSQIAFQLPLLAGEEPSTQNLLQDIKEGLQYVFQTRNEWTFAILGTATTAIQAVFDNLVEPGDKVLVGVNGYWGELIVNISQRLDADVIKLKKPTGKVFSFKEIADGVKLYKPRILALVHAESTAGAYQRLDGVGELCQREGCLFISDSTSIVGMQPLLMDKFKMDATFTSSQKGLGGVAGLAPVSLSPRAVAKIQRRKKHPGSYPTDLLQNYRAWHGIESYQSISVPLLYSLREALATIADKQIENTYERHLNATLLLNKQLDSLRLRIYVENREDRMIGITSVFVPMGKDPYKVSDYLLQKHRIHISTGYGELTGKVLRFAVYGTNADSVRIHFLISALKEALSSPRTNVD